MQRYYYSYILVENYAVVLIDDVENEARCKERFKIYLKNKT